MFLKAVPEQKNRNVILQLNEDLKVRTSNSKYWQRFFFWVSAEKSTLRRNFISTHNSGSVLSLVMICCLCTTVLVIPLGYFDL